MNGFRWILILCFLLTLASSPIGAGAMSETPDAVSKPDAMSVDDLLRLNNLGSAHLARFREVEAIEAFRKALEMDPGYAVARTNLGIALLSLADYPAAEEELRRSLEGNPGEPHALFNLGLALKIQGNTAEAMQCFEQVRQIDPDDPDTLYQLGSLYARERRLEEAIEAYRRSIEMGPGNVSAYYGLGKVLLQSGDSEQGRVYMEQSQAMKQEGLTTSVGTRYGEQGKYSYSLEDDRVRSLARSAAPPSIPVRFVRVKKSGLDPARGKASHCGPGPSVSAVDLEGDGDLDLLISDCRKIRLFRNDGDLRFSDITADRLPADLPPITAGVFGDVDNDGRADLFLTGPGGTRFLLAGEDGRFQDGTDAAGLGLEGPCSGAAWADVDHDGDLDLYVLRRDLVGGANPNLLFRNRGDGTFFEDAGPSGLQGRKGAAAGLVFSDVDNDRDIDLVLSGEAGAWQLMRNDRVGTFTDVAEALRLSGEAALGVAVGDYNKDGFMDLAATGPQGLRLYRNGSGGAFQSVELPLGATVVPAAGVTFLDFDNDGFLDLAAASAEKEGPAVRVLRNVGEGRFEDRTADVGLGEVAARGGRSLLALDLDEDGDLDLLITRLGHSPLLLRNDGGSRHRSLQVDAVGRGSNRGGVGTKVELKSGRLWQKMEVVSASGYLSGSPGRVHFGLGDRDQVDTLRLLWPSGVLQDEIDPVESPVARVQELDRKGSSCPILYAWNGDAFGFVTDFLGGAAIGYRVGGEAFNTPDTDEYVKLRGDQLSPRDGRLELRLVNQLEEVIFFDDVSLLAVDHADDRTIHPNERLLPAPPFPEFELFAMEEERPPIAAREAGGNDVLEKLIDLDRDWPAGFALLPFKGYAEEHALEIDPGPLPSDRRLVLLADAWIDYADSTSNLAASQAGLSLLPPRLEVVGEDGEWTVAIPQMGFPAGLPKTLAVELTGRFRRDDDHRIRIVTNMRIYVDRIRFGIVDEEAGLKVTELEASESDLRFRGYPRPVSPDGRAPFGYDYHDAARAAGWKDFEGSSTAYGDVTGLLRGTDDRYVITRHGDEIALSFDADSLPDLPEGWTRTWILYADGFGKDMDLNSAAPDRIEPLPFHGMERYPPSNEDQNRVDLERLDWLQKSHKRPHHSRIPPSR